MIKVPESLKSSKGDGHISRTLKGLGATLVFFGAMYTPMTEHELAAVFKGILILVATTYSLIGLFLKAWNRTHTEKI